MQRARVRYPQDLFEEPPDVRAVQLPPEVQERLRQALAQWMQALAKMLRKEDGDE